MRLVPIVPFVLSYLAPHGATAYAVPNVTGLPVFPSLSRAAMDPAAKTDTLGHWCIRFAAQSQYPLAQVEAWYRKALANASETNLADDGSYRPYPNLVGIKLTLGIDHVTVFRFANQSTTSIELFKCTWTK